MHFNLQWLILYASGLFFRNGSGSWISSSFKKTDKKNSRHWVTCKLQRTRHLFEWEGFPHQRGTNIQIKSCNFRSCCKKSWKSTRDVKRSRRKKQEVMISDWLDLCEGLTWSFSKLLINGALGPLTQKATFDWFSSAAHATTTQSQSKSSTISQMIEYERHSLKLVPKPAVTFQTNAVWLEETLVRFIRFCFNNPWKDSRLFSTDQ